jgi:hypothetical protein
VTQETARGASHTLRPFHAAGIRICGAATLVVVSISLVEGGQALLDVDLLPGLWMPLWLAVLVSLVAFLVANAPRRAIAKSLCLGAVAVVAVLSVLHVHAAGVASLGFLGVALALFDYALLGELCRRVMARRAVSRA